MRECHVAALDQREEYTALARKHFEDIWPIVRWMTPSSEEAVALLQDTLVQEVDHFDGEIGPSDFKVWLLNRVHRTHQERNGSAVELPRSPVNEAGYAAPPALADSLRALPFPLRMPVVLCDVGGLSYRDIARVLDLPVGAVRARVHRARQRLLDPASASGYAPATEEASDTGADDRRPEQMGGS